MLCVPSRQEFDKINFEVFKQATGLKDYKWDGVSHAEYINYLNGQLHSVLSALQVLGEEIPAVGKILSSLKG